jgi:cysteinyl-tRNA synthetase
MLNIYNSLTRSKEQFWPLDPGHVGMYVCGMTVYDYCHLGHGRVMVVFDTVVRYLRARGYAVTYVRNITDIDDKIIKRAQDNQEDFFALTARFIQAMHEDAERLGLLPPDAEPRATQSIDAILAMVATLLERGYAYQAENGDVYYDVSRFGRYGELSGKRLEDLRAGARVEVNEAKRDPLDFVLWKAAKPGEPSWDAPWGAGRPGWHIECSAMSTQRLGAHFDIHGGGQDLQFPHHENEIAQSEAATGDKFVNYWMHVGFVRVNEEKMSKSLGNVFNLRDVMDAFHPEVVRYFLLSSHYRSPLNYSDEQLRDARLALTRLYLALRDMPAGDAAAPGEIAERFYAAMEDDFNTPEALAVLFELSRALNRAKEEDPAAALALAALLRSLGSVLGLLQSDPDAFLKEPIHLRAADALSVPLVEGVRVEVGYGPAQIEDLIKARTAARQRKDWAEADRIRAELNSRGVVLEDRPDGVTVWRRG